MKKRLLLVCLLLMLLPVLAFADVRGVRMPDRRGTVTDDADILSPQMVEDITAYAEEVADETDIRLHTAIVHFLDGLDAQSYADSLFARWGLGEDDILLLAAAGEDSFATAMGANVQKALGKTNADNLMFTSSAFSALFTSQQYDAAFAAYYPAFNALLEKQMGAHIRMGKLFGQTESRTQSPAAGSELWTDVMEAISDTSDHFIERHKEGEREKGGLTLGGWIVLFLLLSTITRQNKAQKKRWKRDKRYRRGPLGWIIGLLGINLLADRLRRRH